MPVETKKFWEIPQAIEEYQKPKTNITSIEKYPKRMITHHKWKLNNQQREQVIFDKLNRNIDEIKNKYERR